jgi:hypothetical protein
VLPIKLPDILKTLSERFDEQDFRVREESGAVAPALVLHHDAQDVWQGSNAGQATDAGARVGLGQHRDGSGAGAKAESFVEVYSTGEGAHGFACRMSVLSRHQFCRWQKSGFE